MTSPTKPADGSRYAFVRTEEAPRLPPPPSEVGLMGWLWRNLFRSMTNFSSVGAGVTSILMIIVTFYVGYLSVVVTWDIVMFALVDAVWSADEGVKREACTTVNQNGKLPADWFGACYPFISAKWQQLIYGRYPTEELWRVNLVFLIGGLGVSWLVADAIPRRRQVGVALVIIGCAYGLLLTTDALYSETFGARVGVQLLIGVGVIYALAPVHLLRRTIGVLMLTVFPIAAFLLLTGGDLEIGAGFWWGVGALFALFGGVAIASRLGYLGAAGEAFGGLARLAALLVVALAATVFVSSTRFVDIVEAAGGATLTERETRAVEWWSENNKIDAPLLASAIDSVGVAGWGEAEAQSLALKISEELGGVWDVDAALATTQSFDSSLSSASLDRLEIRIRRLAAAPPSPRQVAQFGIDTGVVLSETELARLEAVSWRSNFWNVASAPDERIVWPLPPVQTELWGGLLVTLVVAIAGIVFSLPLGILLALGRRSSLPAVRYLSIGFIEFWRGVPLITVLFMSSVMLPLFLPEGADFNKLVRALIGVMMFSAAYQAEVVRGGLQAIPKGQFEAAQAIGLSYWPSMGLIILPQALTLVIPGIVNTFIGLFKDTALVSIIGIFDLLNAVNTSFTDSAWATPVTQSTGYLIICLIYFIFCFAMSRYSMFMERKLRRGHAR